MSGSGPPNPFEGVPFFGDIAKLFTSSGPVNWDVAKQMAQWLALDGNTTEANVEPMQRIRFEELFRIAEMHVAEATGLPTSASGRPPTVRCVGRIEWATRTLEDYRPLLEALATSVGTSSMPAAEIGEPGVHDPAGELLGNFAQLMSPMLLGMQSGVMVGNLAQRAMSQYNLPIPRQAGDEILVVPSNIDSFASDWSLPLDDVRLWICLSELVHHAVLVRPHVRARLDELLLSYVSGFQPDAASLETRLEGVDPSDPESLRNALGDPEALLGAMQTPEQRQTLVHLEALVCAIVGYVDHVLDGTGRRLVGESASLVEALRRQRVTRGDGERFVERLFGLELGQAQFDRGAAFVSGVVERAGDDGLARLWGSARELPTPSEVDAPGLWLERIDLPD